MRELTTEEDLKAKPKKNGQKSKSRSAMPDDAGRTGRWGRETSGAWNCIKEANGLIEGRDTEYEVTAGVRRNLRVYSKAETTKNATKEYWWMLVQSLVQICRDKGVTLPYKKRLMGKKFQALWAQKEDDDGDWIVFGYTGTISLLSRQYECGGLKRKHQLPFADISSKRLITKWDE